MDMDIETSNTRLQDLNEDCLRHIFQYLNFNDKLHFYKVFTKWIHVSPGFWKISQFGVVNLAEIDSDEWPDLMSNGPLNFMEFQEIVLICGSTFQKLSIFLRGDSYFPKPLVCSFDGTGYRLDEEFSYEAALDILGEACCNLKVLEVRSSSGHPLLSDKFHALFLANEKLAEVHLDCRCESDLYNIVRLKDLPGPAKVLHLHYENFSSTDVDKNVDFICDLLESRKIDLKKLSLWFGNPIHTSRLLKLVVNYAKGLQVLKILKSVGQEDNPRFEELSALGELEELLLQYIDISNDQISAIVDGCKKLKKVKLHACTGINETGINTVMTSLPELVSVSLENLDIRSILQTNAQLGSNLQRLKISGPFEYMEVDEVKKISLFTNLEELYLLSGHLVIDEVIFAITDGCRKLRKVVLKDCYKMTCEGINTIMTTLPKLESVELSGLEADLTLRSDVQLSVRNFKLFYTNISEDSLKKMSLFKNLEVLDLEAVHNVTDEVLVTITSACKKLKKVLIRGCSRITGGGINSLVSSSPNLETLELRNLCLGSLFLTQESNLQRLSICSDESFSYGDLKTFIAKLPQLKHIFIRQQIIYT